MALRQVFDGHPIVHRHTEADDWIHLADRDALMRGVERDARAFFPELLGDDSPLWFALDVDRRHHPPPQAATVASAICTVLDEHALPYLLTFSGTVESSWGPF